MCFLTLLSFSSPHILPGPDVLGFALGCLLRLAQCRLDSLFVFCLLFSCTAHGFPTRALAVFQPFLNLCMASVRVTVTHEITKKKNSGLPLWRQPPHPLPNVPNLSIYFRTHLHASQSQYFQTLGRKKCCNQLEKLIRDINLAVKSFCTHCNLHTQLRECVPGCLYFVSHGRQQRERANPGHQRLTRAIHWGLDTRADASQNQAPSVYRKVYKQTQGTCPLLDFVIYASLSTRKHVTPHTHRHRCTHPEELQNACTNKTNKLPSTKNSTHNPSCSHEVWRHGNHISLRNAQLICEEQQF